MAEEDSFLVPNDTYMKAGVHIGTKFKTKYMEPYIYKTRPDGLAVLNVQAIDKNLRLTAEFLAKYEPDDIVLACRRENGWQAAQLFGQATGTRVFTGRYPPGTFTNIELATFQEAKLLLVADPWPDRNSLKDARFAGMKIVALCDTNNETNKVDMVIPCNNKGRQSLGLIFFLLAREYNKLKGKSMDVPMEEFLKE